MSTPTYTITQSEDSDGKELATITVIFSDGSTRATNSTNGNYKAVVKAVAIDEADDDTVRDLLTPALGVGSILRSLSERVLFDQQNIFFDGDVIDSSLTNHIVQILNEGGAEVKWRALVNFMEKLHQNPSQKSIDSLYEFLRRQGITILPDGDFLAYKGLNADGTSISSGYGIVNGTVYQNAHLPNDKGAVVEIPRSKVNADTRVGCSTGLHAGSYTYARDFARGMLVTVKVNPRDVVSVPDDCHYQKIRTARYIVMDQTEVKYEQSTFASSEYNDEDYDDDYAADEDYEGDAFDEAEADLEEFRSDNLDRDYVAEPLTFSEVEIFAAAQGQSVWLSDEEEDALEAYNEGLFASQGDLNVTGFSNTDKADDAKPAQDVKADAPSAPVAHQPRTVVGLTKPSNADFERQLQAEIDGEENIVLSFDYTRGDGSQTTVENFAPEDIERRGTDLLITGINAEGQYRSYYYGRMENLSVRDADTEPKHAS